MNYVKKLTKHLFITSEFEKVLRFLLFFINLIL